MDTVSIELKCNETKGKEKETKDGSINVFKTIYKGTAWQNDLPIQIELSFQSEDLKVLEEIVPSIIGAKRKVEIMLSDEDLDHFTE